MQHVLYHIYDKVFISSVTCDTDLAEAFLDTWLLINCRHFHNLPNTSRESLYFSNLRQVANRTDTLTSSKKR